MHATAEGIFLDLTHTGRQKFRSAQTISRSAPFLKKVCQVMTNSTHRTLWISLVAIAFISGCASVPPILCEGRKLEVVIRCNPNTQSGMKKDAIEDRNKVAALTVEDLSKRLTDAGCNASVESAGESYATGPGRYILSITIKDLHVVGDATQFWVGGMAGASWVDFHYELVGDGKAPILSYDNQDGSINGWRSCIEQLDKKAVTRVMGQLRAMHGSSSSAPSHP